MIIAKQVYQHLTSKSRTTHNVSEWAKREECWTRFKTQRIDLTSEFKRGLEGGIARAARTKQAVSNQRIDTGIAAQTTVLATPIQTWQELKQFCLTRRLAASRDLGVLDVALRGGLPSEKQSAVLLQLLGRAGEHGFGGGS